VLEAYDASRNVYVARRAEVDPPRLAPSGVLVEVSPDGLTLPAGVALRGRVDGRAVEVVTAAAGEGSPLCPEPCAVGVVSGDGTRALVRKAAFAVAVLAADDRTHFRRPDAAAS
jgi:hypothetical protein